MNAFDDAPEDALSATTPAAEPPAQAPGPSQGPPTEPVETEQVPAAEDGSPGAESAQSPDPLVVLQAERDEYLDALRRVQADFENYRKRIQKQQAEHAERAAESLVKELLPVLDTIDLALAHAAGTGDVEGTDQAAGLAHVAASLVEVLTRQGLERIDPQGHAFDPTEHEAVVHEPEGGGGQTEVTEVMRAGYRWKGRVVRPAMVKVKG